jgi:hypothetical protein
MIESVLALFRDSQSRYVDSFFHAESEDKKNQTALFEKVNNHFIYLKLQVQAVRWDDLRQQALSRDFH